VIVDRRAHGLTRQPVIEDVQPTLGDVPTRGGRVGFQVKLEESVRVDTGLTALSAGLIDFIPEGWGAG